MSRYAEGTSVSVERTRIEVEETLRRFGASAFSSGYEDNVAFIMFRARNRFVRLTLPLPDAADKAFQKSPTGRVRSADTARSEYEAECRRRWRSLGLLVKAKLAAVQDGIVEFEDEFLAHVVLPDGSRVMDHTKPALALSYEKGDMPTLLSPPRKP